MNSIRKKIELIKRALEACRETTLVIPVGLILLALIGNSVVAQKLKRALAADENPAYLALANTEIPVNEALAAFGTLAAIENKSAPDESGPMTEEDFLAGSLIIDDSALLNTGNPLSANIINRDGLIIYKIQKGDTLSSVAANFGISLDTIYWANKGVKSSVLSIGQEILILPVSGVIHQIQEGETLDEIASRYEISEARIMKYNAKILARGAFSGLNLIIPGAKPLKGGVISSASNLPNFAGYYTLPTTGWNWGKIHHNNAVDIANACGTPVYAAAEGLVTEVKSSGWNEGYGNFVIIEHPNNTKTRYAHNQKNVVSIGDYILQGDIIAYIGNTGLTHGPTGCHVHFEIMGARNPFVK